MLRRASVATLGQRIAGGMLVVNALLAMVSVDLVPDVSRSGGWFGPASVLAAIFDVIIGVLLVMNIGRLAIWAIVRVALGLVLYTLINVGAGDLASAGIQVGISGALLLLLIGQAGLVRIVLGCALFGLYLVFASAGMSMLMTRSDRIGAMMQEVQRELDVAVDGRLVGEASAYQLQVPDTGWHHRNPVLMRRDNPLADRWLIQPNRDSHLLVIDEAMPGGVLAPVDVATDVVINNGRLASSSYTLVSREPLSAYPEQGRLLHTRSTARGLDLEAWVAVVSVAGRGYQIMGMARQANFAAVSSELRTMVESFRLPEGSPLQIPGVVPGPAGRVLGVGASYAITAPGEQWHLRTAEAARADNPSADRWIIRPELDAHVFVSFEDMSEAVPLATLVTTLQGLMRGQNSAAEFGPVQPGPRGSLGFHASMPGDKLNIEFEYRLHIVGQRSFQVVGFARKELYPTVAEELREVLDSFEPLP